MAATHRTDDARLALVLLEELLSCQYAPRSHSAVRLFESDPAAKLRTLTLTGLTPDYLVLNTDKGRIMGRTVCMSPLFAHTSRHGHNRACDAVILRLKRDGGLEVCYLDLKSDKPSGYEEQFISTRCMMHYVVDLLNKLPTTHKQLHRTLQITRERFVIFHTDSGGALPPGRKRPTRHTFDERNQPGRPVMFVVPDGAYRRVTEVF